ncbi:hypothetical protein DFH28DRAFT_579835 [Melampsora americana]|nr:hypothetical protein DFH28DRAFT_579835 [Melampsora americana]
MSHPSIKLTKKQKKSIAFRTKKKSKSSTQAEEEEEERLAFPETEEEEEEEPITSTKTTHSILKSSKRKREETERNSKDHETIEKDQTDEMMMGVAAKRRKRKKLAKLKKEEEDQKRKSSKLILFVGNLPFDMTHEKLKSFFLEHCEEEPEVRLMTHKSSNQPSEKPNHLTKGCGFVEFKTSAALQKALRLHHTPMSSESTGEENQKKSRKINIELTAGGGGRSENRLKKIKDSKERLDKQREKRIEKSIKEITEKRSKYGLEALEPGQEDVTVKFGHKKKSDIGVEEGKANWGSKSNSNHDHHPQSSKPPRFKGRPQSSGANSIRLT